MRRKLRGPLVGGGRATHRPARRHPVAVGTGDDFSTPLGRRIVGPGQLAVVLGTGEVVGAVHPRLVIDDAGLVETHAYPGGAYFLENPGWLSGGAVTWLCEMLSIDGFEALHAEAATVPPGAAGLTFIPALTGAMAPVWNASARGCFYGLTPSHTRAHMARALLEGCAFAMRDVADRLKELGAEIRSVLLLGGGARSRLWAQIRADVLGLPALCRPRRQFACRRRHAGGRCRRSDRESARGRRNGAGARGPAGAGGGDPRRLWRGLWPIPPLVRQSAAAVRAGGTADAAAERNRLGREASIH